MSELFDVYDNQNMPLGITKARPDVHRDGDWHRTVHIYVVNNEGQYLVHLRSPLKDAKPNCWDTRFGGHVTAGMDYNQTALQEVEQEIGIKASIDQLISSHQESYDGGTNREHIHVYFYQFNRDIKDLHFNDNEVVQVKWMTPEEIITAINNEPMRWAGGVNNFENINQTYNKIYGKQ